MGNINSFLLLRGKIYYFNFWLPKDIRGFFGNTDCIRRTLKTSNKKEAAQKARHLSVQLEHLFSRARSGMHSELEIKKWVREFFQLRFWVYETYSAAGGFKGCGLQERKGGYEDWEAIAKKDLVQGNIDRIGEDAESWLQIRKIDLDKASLEFGLFCRELLKAEIQFYRILQRRAEGDYGDLYSDLESKNDFIPALKQNQKFNDNFSATTHPVENREFKVLKDVESSNHILAATTSPSADNVVRLDEAIEKYFAGYKADNRVIIKSLDEFEAICRLFLEIVGNIEVREINDDIITTFIQKLSKIPKNRNKNPQWRNFSALELSSMNLPTNALMSETTINKYIQRVSSLLNYCCKRRRWIDYNPAEGRKYTKVFGKKGKKDKRRVSYTQEELQKMINELARFKVSGILESSPEKFYIPLIALYGGMRLQEICQLYLNDIYQKDDIWVFDINEKSPDKSLKTDRKSVV